MFRRLARLRVVGSVTLLLLLVVVVACKGSPAQPKAADAAPAVAPTPAGAFEVTPPAGFHPASPAPPAPVVHAWEGERQPNGFAPSFSLVRRPRPFGTDEQIYVTWKDELVAVLKKKYRDVKLIEEAALTSQPAGKRIVFVVTLPVPGSPEGAIPMPLYTYGGLVLTGDTLWEMGALTSCTLDASNGMISPAGEPEILKALASFRVR
jgi:hypothetical protein